MALNVEHELHTRRRGRNWGVGIILISFVAIVFGLTVVKVLSLGDIRQMERFDHVARPQLEPAAIEAAAAARDAQAATATEEASQ